MSVETSNTNEAEKFIPHPVLDDPSRMMKIIANPVYDKLTVSRAAQFKHQNSFEQNRKSVVTNKRKQTTFIKSLLPEDIGTTSLTNNTKQTPRKYTSKMNSIPVARVSSKKRASSKSTKTKAESAASSDGERDKSPIPEGTIRYINTRHGFEVQRYSSHNWLSIDLLTKDACQSQDKSFREMLNKKQKDELSAHKVYTSEYYRKRWNDLLQSYKENNLTYEEWARQSYQLNCLRTYYKRAREREEYIVQMNEQDQRERRALSSFNQWKVAKDEENLKQNRSQSSIDPFQYSFNDTSIQSTGHQVANTNNKKDFISVLDILRDEPDSLSLSRTMNQLKTMIATPKQDTKFDEERWSLKAMVRRVVGLAEPLPPIKKVPDGHSSLATNSSNDSGFESSLQ